MEFLYDSSDKTSVATLPTAWGKSLLLSWLGVTLHEDGHKVLMVVPSVELLKQNLEKIESYGLVEVGVFSGSMSRKESDKPIIIATVNSLKGAHTELKDYKYILVDEAHFKYPSKGGTFKTFIQKVKPKKILGVTATPFSLGTKGGFSVLNMLSKQPYAIFKTMCHITQISEVIAEKRWSPIKYINYPYIREGLVLNTTGNDFTEESIAEVNKLNNVNNIAAKLIQKLEKGDKAICYVESVDVGETLCDWLKSKGVAVEIITANTKKKDRSNIVKTFKETKEIRCLINVGTLTMGLDCPDLTHIVMARPTNSLALYYQIIGRGVRVLKGKTHFNYTDLCGNIDHFGGIETLTVEFVVGYGWAVFNGEKLITGIPLNISKEIFKEDLLKKRFIPYPTTKLKLDFGKFNGTLLNKIPKHYRDYVLGTMENETYMSKEKKEIEEYLLKLQEFEVNQLILKG